MNNKVKNLFDFQTFSKIFPVKIRYYTSDHDDEIPLDKVKEFLTGWGRVNEEGILLTKKKSLDPKHHTFSWTFTQTLNCLPRIGKEIIKEGRYNIPKSLIKIFPNINCCFRLSTEWVKRPVDMILCSLQTNSDMCQVEAKILRATSYKRCINKSIIELDDIMKSNKKFSIPENKKKEVCWDL